MKLALLLTAFLIALETAIPLWRSSAPTSSAPVFSLPMMDAAMKNPGEFQRSIDVYHADRGGELKLPGPDNTSLTLFYFEWDQVEAGPMMDIAGHRPEECNVVAGFKLMSHDLSRTFQSETPTPLVFDTTTFADPAGNPVVVYKTAWFQGQGSREIREGENRRLRFQNSFERGSGAARVIECGITGAHDPDQAWQIFQSEVLSKLIWKNR
jgi:hypothetical protein